MTSSIENLELANLAFYAIMCLPALYCAIKHGKIGLVGWFYVNVMCGLRLVGNGMAYHSLSTTGEPSKAGTIITGIGLSPLVLAALGILNEANHSIQPTLSPFLRPFGLLIPHVVIGGGIGLAAASGNNPHLLQAGMIIFATGWTIIVGLVILSYKSNANGSRLNDEKKLLVAIIIAMPLIGIRIVYAIAGAFSSKGGLAVQVIFGTLPEFLVMIDYVSVGIMTRNLGFYRSKKSPEPTYNTVYTTV